MPILLLKRTNGSYQWLAALRQLMESLHSDAFTNVIGNK